MLNREWVSNVSLLLTLFFLRGHKCAFLKLYHAEGWRTNCHKDERASTENQEPTLECI